VRGIIFAALPVRTTTTTASTTTTSAQSFVKLDVKEIAAGQAQNFLQEVIMETL